MDIFDKSKGKDSQAPVENENADGLPNMQAQQGRNEFRAREKVATTATEVDENEGLPSVNRRKGGNKMVTILGFVFILGAAAAMIVAVNDDKDPKTKKTRGTEDQVANNLPPIVIPATPPPPQVPAIAAQPIPLQDRAQPGSGKAPLDWTDRKKGGTLLVNTQTNSGGATAPVAAAAGPVNSGGATAPPAASPVQLENAISALTGQRSGVASNNELKSSNDLKTKLEPTVTNGVSASMLPDRNFLITKGTSLDCALETALDSSTPGITTCRLTRDVYSDNGHVLLLDRGSQLVGEYQGDLKQGQARLFVLWTRVKTPNGVIVSLNSPGADALGRSGMEGWVDNHFMERFGAAILMSLIKESVTIIANRSGGGGGGGGTTNVFGSAATGGEKIVEKILDSTVSIPPTFIKNQGDHIQVMAARDMDFSGVYGLLVKPWTTQ
ncbi:TrbI/VirB10 family protein [Verminephrobacter aporrectodeae subsp. tuberculatae]|uniref:type IV secretion system protein VirB10 n=1 Tax=Verminephrobacter aporrectodeae TaxID=1110389 RepID=UPI0002378525|nr:type IV secretion system protein VirB10 [Verminephrobacter aporrectodeae]MCW8166990.1 TrbI/VirB10 family protein [Verminephrobacter aporrectodeae subsp. tuberculatae]MCW8171168.1 TrbI/VirB10 family protein [Verminephrobacter aporrectodeae subsp. tuberculatae]